MKIGFLGLGTMGKPMAANLVKAGYQVRVWNRSPEPVAELQTRGGDVAGAPSQAAADADVLISMLSDDDVTRAVVLEADVLNALKPGAIHVNMATISVDFAADMARLHRERQLQYVAAPVLGRIDVAEAGQLQVLAAGHAEALASVQPLFDALGQQTWHFGDRPEQANAVKLAVNFMIANAIGAMGDASALVQGHGVCPAAFLDLVTSTSFASPVYKGYGQAIKAQRFEPAGFKVELGLKDLRLALEAGDNARVPLPLASLLKDNLLDALAHGEGHLDWAALSQVSARRAGQD